MKVLQGGQVFEMCFDGRGLVPLVVDGSMIGRKVRQKSSGDIMIVVGKSQYGLDCVSINDARMVNNQSVDARSPYASISLIDESIASQAEIEFLIQSAQEKKVRDMDAANAAYAEKERQVAELIAKMRAEAKIKISVSKNGYPMPGKNLKAEILQAYPELKGKLSVKYDSFSGGDSISVNLNEEYKDLVKGVKDIADRYSGGSFNGMEDIYEYNGSVRSKAQSAVYGDAKYVSVYISRSSV